MNITRRMLVRGGMILAIALVIQELRFILPLPTIVSLLVIGTLLNAALVISARFTGLMPAVVLAICLPIVAYLQGHIFVPVMIPVIALGNFVFVTICSKWWGNGVFIIAPIIKTFTLYCGTLLVLWQFGIDKKFADIILFSMGWPQLVTAILGVILAVQLEQRLPSEKN